MWVRTTENKLVNLEHFERITIENNGDGKHGLLARSRSSVVVLLETDTRENAESAMQTINVELRRDSRHLDLNPFGVGK